MIVLLSGGQDSTTCLYWALRHAAGAPVDALAVDYGQRHRRELDAARCIANEAGVQLHLARLDLPLASALTSGQELGRRPDGLPTTFVPGRNGLFLWAAAGLAKQHGRNTVVIGCSAVDYSGYPDCRPEFLRAQQGAIALGLEMPNFTIAAPLIDRSKAQTVRMMRELDVRDGRAWRALGMSWTCYLGGARPCGECPACVLRAKGFAEADLTDPAL